MFAVSDALQHYLSTLKDHRIATADFVRHLNENTLNDTDRLLMNKRLLTLIADSREHGYLAVQTVAQTLERTLMGNASAHELLPLATALHDAVHHALLFLPDTHAEAHERTPLAAGAKKPLILTIDDDRIVRVMVESLFEHDAVVKAAADGKAGLELIRATNPDLVLLDDAMPEMTGLTLLETLHADPQLRHIRVIMLTSSDRPEDFARAEMAGALDYVLKPFRPGELARKVRQALAY